MSKRSHHAGRLAGALTLSAVLVASSGAGCHLLERSAEEEPADHDAEIDPADYAEQVDAKLRRFSACRDIVASVMGESWERYSDQVTEEGEPRRREGVYLRGIGDNTFRTCRRVLEAAKTPPPMPVIEAAAAELVAASSRFAELTRTLDGYIDEQGYREDDWATLAELDPQLRAAHEAWTEADRALQQAIDLRHVENDPILLGVLEVRRSPLEVATRKLMIHARPMVRCMTAEDSPSAERCQPKFAAFDEAVAEFERIYANDRAAADKVFWMSTFANDIEEFHALAADFQRKLGQRRPKPGDVQALIDGYSSLVRDAETLDFDFP